MVGLIPYAEITPIIWMPLIVALIIGTYAFVSWFNEHKYTKNQPDIAIDALVEQVFARERAIREECTALLEQEIKQLTLEAQQGLVEARAMLQEDLLWTSSNLVDYTTLIQWHEVGSIPTVSTD